MSGSLSRLLMEMVSDALSDACSRDTGLSCDWWIGYAAGLNDAACAVRDAEEDWGHDSQAD